jgi:hypothetical protein
VCRLHYKLDIFPPYQFRKASPRSTPAVAFKGDLRSLSLSTVLQILCSENKTGVLEIVRPQTKSAIYLKGGKIVAASTGQKELQLGQILCARGLISKGKLQEALDRARLSKKRLGEVLMAAGYVSPEELKAVVRDQVREAVLNVFLWEEGEFEYKDCPVEFDARLVEEINAMEIMLEAARRMDEWSVMKKVIPSDTLVFEISKQASQQGGKVTLDTGEWRIISMLDGSKSVREVVRESGAAEFEVYKALYAMATSRLIHPTDKPAPSKEKTGAEEVANFLPIYHDVLITISKHLEEQLGGDFCAKLTVRCKTALPKESKQILAGYQVHQSADENVQATLTATAGLPQGAAALSVIATAFTQMIGCMLHQEIDILGSKQTIHTISRINELLGVVERYRAGETKSRLIQGIKGVLAQVAAGLKA